MDGDQFDAIIRTLPSGSSRRGVLGGVLGGLAGAFTGLLGHEAASVAAKHHKRRNGRGILTQNSAQRKCKAGNHPCAFDTHCCSGLCCNHLCCDPGESCNGNGACEVISPPPSPPPCPICTGLCGSPGGCPGGCICGRSVEGIAFCVAIADDNCDPPCTSSTECGGGFCASADCCTGSRCVPAANICAT
jgi:hypothetical protein